MKVAKYNKQAETNEAEAPRKLSSSEKAKGGMIRKVLFVDDDPILRSALEKRLSTCADDFLFFTAGDGFEAVKLLKEHPFSLVILDLIMPRMDGMSLLGHLHEHFPDVPTVIVSSMPPEQLRALANHAGVVKAYSKPFRADALIDTIAKVLRREAEGGIMYSISPSVFLQLMEMDQKTCTIRIIDNTSGMGGILFFSEGRLLDARIGLERGIEAAYRAFSFDPATIFIRNTCPPLADRINSDLGPIIMRAASLRDEAEGDGNWDEEDEPSSTLDNFFARNSPSDQPKHVSSQQEQLAEQFRTILSKKFGRDFALRIAKKPYDSKTLTARLNELGTASGFSSCKGVIGDRPDQTIRFLLPTRPPLWLEVDRSCPRDALMRLLISVK